MKSYLRGERGVLVDQKKEALQEEPEVRYDIIVVPCKGYPGSPGLEVLMSAGMKGYSLKAVSDGFAFLERPY